MSRRPLFVCTALLLATVPLLLSARANAAEGLNLAWNHCMGEGTGVQNVTFACDTNSGSHVIDGSFVLGVNVHAIIGLEIVVDLASASASLPDWWMFRNAGTCRTTSLSVNVTEDPSDVVCQDWSLGQSFGGLAGYHTYGQFEAFPNAARIIIASPVMQAQAQDLVVGIEYFAFHLLINHAKTVGAGSCAGCATPVSSGLNSINVVGLHDSGSRLLTTPSAPGSNFVAWQGGGVPVVGSVSGCPAATATHRSRWAEVKALYR